MVIQMSDTITRKHTQRRRRRHIAPIWPVLGVLVLFILLVIGVISIASTSNKTLTLALQGESTVTLEFGSGYLEAGYKALYGQTDVSAAVTATGNVNPDKLGTYGITYTVQYDGQIATAQRTVRVVDTEKPTITLIHNDNNYPFAGLPYEEEGFSAQDNYDGDITHKVQRVEQEDSILYWVEDSSGNRAEAIRSFQKDTVAPVLTLLGNETVTLPAGIDYLEPGFTAIDNVDGDITNKVQIQGAIDIYTPGTYTVTYTVTDSFHNTTTVVRTVIIEKATQPPVVQPTGKVIYLTFDDGPSQHTPRLLSILKKYNVKATFFVVGTASIGYLDDIAADGHAIALHSNTHDYNKIYASEEAFYEDLNALRLKIKSYCGVDTTLIRFPGGSSNTISKKLCPGIMTRLTQSVVAQGYQYFDWNVDSRDAGGATTADEVYRNVINGVQQHNASVVLQHDIFGYSVDAVEQIIQWGLANGYTFLALDPTSPGAHHDVSN